MPISSTRWAIPILTSNGDRRPARLAAIGFGRDRRSRHTGGLGLPSIEPNDGGGKVDRRQEVAGRLVVSGSDGTKLLQFAEKVLDQVAFLVEVLVVIARVFSIAVGRDDRCFAGIS